MLYFPLPRLPAFCGRYDGDHARCGLGPRHIHSRDPPFGDARADNVAVRRGREHVVPFVGVGRVARRLERTINTICGVTDDLEVINRIGRCGSVEFHGSAFRFGQNGTERAFNEGQLERVLLGGSRALKQASSDSLRTVAHFGLCRLDPPRLVRNASDCHTAGTVRMNDGANRNKSECIGCAITDLSVDVLAADRLGKRHRCDELARCEHRLDVGRIARKTMKVRNRNSARNSVWPYGLYR